MKSACCLALLAVLCFGQPSITDIVGPSITDAGVPWPYYVDAAEANSDALFTAMMAYEPTLGTALTGTWDLQDGCAPGIKLAENGGGADTSEVSVGDWLIVAWNATDGMGTGRLLFVVSAKDATTLTMGTRCGVAPASAGTALTVYRCTAQCKDDVLDTGISVYSCGYFGICSLAGNNVWNFYDPALAEYRRYLADGESVHLTNFRYLADKWWTWALDQGGKYFGVPRTISPTSMFLRAMDGHSERFNPLYGVFSAHVASAFFTVPDGNDNREPGYMLLTGALGALTDATNRTAYCTFLDTATQQWLDLQTAEGYWPERNNHYPYQVNGVSPWRMFAPIQGLARAYDAYIDPNVCNDSTQAAAIYAALVLAGDFLWDYGYNPTTRSVYYDVEHPADGLAGLEAGLKTGTVSVSLSSAAVTGSGTSFTTVFNCNGTDYIGIYDATKNESFTHLVSSCADNTNLTISTNYGTQCRDTPTGPACATANASGATFYRSPASNTSCGNSANYCSPTSGRSFNLEYLWTFGWLYKTSCGLGACTPRWKTYGDELFSSTYGGPGDGPGGSAACVGPNCDGAETDYTAGLAACGSVPCYQGGQQPGTNLNTYFRGPKFYGQGSGIGGADNYLAWRLLTDTPGPQVSISGAVTLSGAASIQ